MDDEFEEGDVVILTSPSGAVTEGYIKKWHGQTIVVGPVERYLHVYEDLGYLVERK